MADNTLLNAGTGGDTIATDELTTLNGGAVSGFKVQRVKPGFGVDASFRDVSAQFGLPVDTDSKRTVTFRGGVGTFRTLGAAALLHNLFSIENAAGSGVLVQVNKINFRMDATAVLVAVVPFIKLSRPTALPTGGTVLTKASRDTAQTSSASVVCRGANTADGAAATAITATQGAMFKADGGMRLHTAVGQVLIDQTDLCTPDNPILLRAGEALLVVVDAAATTSNPATNHWQVSAVWEEYTVA